MKPLILILKFILVFSMQTQYASAQESNEHQDGPCIKLMEACKAAGYNKSMNLKKSLSKDCLQPLLNGQKVEGVTVNADDIEACKAKKAEVKSKK